jgi:hypothetical protein
MAWPPRGFTPLSQFLLLIWISAFKICVLYGDFNFLLSQFLLLIWLLYAKNPFLQAQHWR